MGGITLYDPVETDASFDHLVRIAKKLGDGLAVVGGWAVHLLVRDSFRRATGLDYLRSRDIDVVISTDNRYVARFKAGIERMGFAPGGLPFRYQLVLDRETRRVLDERSAKKRHTFDLLHIDLDVLSSKKVGMATWVMKDLRGALDRKVIVDGIPVARADRVLRMKLASIGMRENADKKEKDACDIYALLFYSELKPSIEIPAVQLFQFAEGYSTIIAETLFNDGGQAGIIRRNLDRLLMGTGSTK